MLIQQSPVLNAVGCCRRRSEDSTRSVDSMMVRLLVRPDGVSTLSSEGSGETAPVPVTLRQGQGQGEFSMRLSGGAGGSQKGASAHLDGSHDSHGGREEFQHSSSSSSSKDSEAEPKVGTPPAGTCSQALGPETPAGDGTDSLDKDAHLCNGCQAEADEHSAGSSGQDPGSAGQDSDSGQDTSAPELQREVSLGNASATSSVTNTDMALYEDLDTLRDEPSALGDLSSESEEDAAIAAERMKLGQFPVEVGTTTPAPQACQARVAVSGLLAGRANILTRVRGRGMLNMMALAKPMNNC